MSTAFADVLDRVRWDYDPAREVMSPLVVTARWFEDFPWEGEDDDLPVAPLAEERG